MGGTGEGAIESTVDKLCLHGCNCIFLFWVRNESYSKLIRSFIKNLKTIFDQPSRSVSALIEPNKDIQKLLKPSSSGDLSKELFHHPAGEEEEEGGLSGPTASLLHITEKRREYLSRGLKRGVILRMWNGDDEYSLAVRRCYRLIPGEKCLQRDDWSLASVSSGEGDEEC